MPDNAARLLKLAEAEFTDLTEPEREVIRCAAGTGELLDIRSWAPLRPKAIMPRKTGGPLIRAEIVSWLCTDRCAQRLVHRKGIRVGNATFDKEINIEGANVPFMFALYRCRVPGINANGASLQTGLFIDECMVCGMIQILGAHIHRQASFSGTKVTGVNNVALRGHNSIFTGSVIISNKFQAKGAVQLNGASISGQLDISSSRFNCKSVPAIDLESALISESLLILNSYLSGKISLFQTRVGNTLLVLSISTPSTVFDFRGAKVGQLFDYSRSWPKGSGKLIIDGFTYDEIHHDSPHTAAERLNWLSLMPQNQFYPQPYEQLANCFQKSGHDNEARTVRIAKENARRKHLTLWRDKFWWWLKSWTIGYGYEPYKAIKCLGIIWLLFAALFYVGYPAGMTQSVSYQYAAASDNATYGTANATNYPDFNALIYSLDVALPIVDLQQERYWMPNSEAKVTGCEFWKNGTLLWWANWIEVVLGWIFASMGIAGATGIIRKD